MCTGGYRHQFAIHKAGLHAGFFSRQVYGKSLPQDVDSLIQEGSNIVTHRGNMNIVCARKG
jgi:hypothetical protein